MIFGWKKKQGDKHKLFSCQYPKAICFFIPICFHSGMMLPGYVPQRGKYNETYIEVINEIVSKSAQYGIFTLLDMHQDVLSPKFCVEGMPDWMVNTGNYKVVLLSNHGKQKQKILSNIKTNMTVLRRCFCLKLALTVWSKCWISSLKLHELLARTENPQDKKVSYKNCLTRKRMIIYGWSLRVLFDKFPCEWWNTNIFWGFRSIMSFGFASVSAL